MWWVLCGGCCVVGVGVGVVVVVVLWCCGGVVEVLCCLGFVLFCFVLFVFLLFASLTRDARSTQTQQLELANLRGRKQVVLHTVAPSGDSGVVLR